jgi:hypothetical protein
MVFDHKGESLEKGERAEYRVNGKVLDTVTFLGMTTGLGDNDGYAIVVGEDGKQYSVLPHLLMPLESDATKWGIVRRNIPRACSAILHQLDISKEERIRWGVEGEHPSHQAGLREAMSGFGGFTLSTDDRAEFRTWLLATSPPKRFVGTPFLREALLAKGWIDGRGEPTPKAVSANRIWYKLHSEGAMPAFEELCAPRPMETEHTFQTSPLSDMESITVSSPRIQGGRQFSLPPCSSMDLLRTAVQSWAAQYPGWCDHLLVNVTGGGSILVLEGKNEWKRR